MKLTAMVRNIFFFAVFCNTNSVLAQLSTSDSTFYQHAINNTINIYQQSIGDQLTLYNGYRYSGYPFGFKDGGHPYFFVEKFLPGSIIYDDVLYNNTSLLYNEVADVIIFKDSTHQIQLITERISAFTIANNSFIRIVADSLHANIPAGFYHLLYNDRLRLLKKEIKIIQEEIVNNNEIVRYIQVKNNFYIKKDDVYYLITNKKMLLKVFEDRKKEIQQYIRNNELNFKRDKENAFIKTIAYYDQLTK